MEAIMKTHRYCHAIIPALALLVTPYANAQAGGAVEGTVGAAGALQRPIPAPPPSAAAGVHGAGAVQAQRPIRDGVGLNANATTHAALEARQTGLTVAALASTGATASLDSRATVEQIRAAAHANRDAILAEVKTRIDASVRATARLRSEARRLDGDARAEFQASIDDVKVREKAVKQSLKTARQARGDAQTAAQSRLAADYTAYAEAVARAEAAATPATPARPAIPREERASRAIPASPSANAEGAAGAAARATTEPKP